MSKFVEVSDETQEVFDSVINEYNLYNFMNIYLRGVEKQKGVVKVQKLSALGEEIAKKPGTVVITIAEEVFENLSPEQQLIVAEDAIAQIEYDSEKDRITLAQPQIQMSLGCWKKYGNELANAYEICCLTAQQIEEKKNEAKKAAAEAKKLNKAGE